MLDIDISSYEEKVLKTKDEIDNYKPFSSKQLKIYNNGLRFDSQLIQMPLNEIVLQKLK